MGKKAVMIMTQFAMMDPGPAGDSLISRCCRGVAQFFGFGDTSGIPTREPIDMHDIPASQDPQPTLQIVASRDEPLPPVTELKWRRHEQLRRQPVHTLSGEERQARQQAVRGLYAAHAGELDVAEELFAKAARHENIDLSELPGFWNLSRQGIMTAVHAYESTDRLRDASALCARIRVEFRPRALSPVPRNVTRLPEHHVPLTGNS